MFSLSKWVDRVLGRKPSLSRRRGKDSKRRLIIESLEHRLAMVTGVSVTGLQNDSYTILHDHTLNANGNAPNLSVRNNDQVIFMAPPTGAPTSVPYTDLTVILVTGTSHGSLSLAANGTFVYTPNAQYVGTDFFTYKVQFTKNGTTYESTNTATANISVANLAPGGVTDLYLDLAGKTITVVASKGVLANDDHVFSVVEQDPNIGPWKHPGSGDETVSVQDVDGDAVTAVLDTPPDSSEGTLNYFNSDGSFEFTAAANFSGVATFKYKTVDTAGGATGQSAPITVRIQVYRPRVIFHQWVQISGSWYDQGWNEQAGTPNQMIGEDIELLADLEGPNATGPFGTLSGATYAWDVDGAIDGFQVTATSGGPMLFKPDSPELASHDIDFYWMTVGSKTASVDISLPDYDLSTSASQLFNIQKPSVSLGVNPGSSKPVYDSNGNMRGVQYGTIGGNEWTSPLGLVFAYRPGIEFEANIGSYAASDFQFVQLVHDQTTISGFVKDSGWGLDNSYPYRKGSDTDGSDNFVYTTDSPYVADDTNADWNQKSSFKRTFDAKMYFQWKSTRPGSIFATLEWVEWGFTQSWVNNGGAWSRETVGGVLANNSDKTPTIHNDESLPEWTKVVTGNP